MVEREQFKVLVKGMRAVYTAPNFIPDADAFNIWYALLRDMPYDVLSSAIQMHMMTQKFAPTIAEIRENCAKILKQNDELNELEAWDLVYKAICNSGYNAVEEFANLPELCKRVIGNAAILKEWSQMNTDSVKSVVMSHFVRNYREILERHRKDTRLTNDLLKLQSKSNQMCIGGVDDV